MNDFMKTLRLALYVCALPLVATAIVSAHSSAPASIQDENGNRQLESIVAITSEAGSVVSDVDPAVSHVLNLDATHGVSGRFLVPGEQGLHGATGLKVTLNRKGKVSAEASTGADGIFRFENPAAGAYTLIASSPNSVATFGVYVVDSGETVPAANELQFNVVAASNNPVAVREVLNSDVTATEYTYLPLSSELPVTRVAASVQLLADGTFKGRVVPLLWNSVEKPFDLTGNEVSLFNAGGKVVSASVDALGYFHLGTVAPGTYDFVSFGPHGAAALAINVEAGTVESVTQNTATQVQEVAPVVVDDCCFETVLTEPVVYGDSMLVEQVAQHPCHDPCNQGFSAGCCGGGYGGGGGGGGFGGLGGFGELIGAAIGVWALSEVFDRQRVVQQPVVVPPVVIPPAVS